MPSAEAVSSSRPLWMSSAQRMLALWPRSTAWQLPFAVSQTMASSLPALSWCQPRLPAIHSLGIDIRTKACRLGLGQSENQGEHRMRNLRVPELSAPKVMAVSPLITRPLTRPVCVPCVCAEVASRSHTLAVQSAEPVTANLRGTVIPVMVGVVLSHIMHARHWATPLFVFNHPAACSMCHAAWKHCLARHSRQDYWYGRSRQTCHGESGPQI